MLLSLATAVSLAAGPPAQAPADPVNHPIAAEHASARDRAPIASLVPERGIRSWGVGADTPERVPGSGAPATPSGESSPGVPPALAAVTLKISGSPMAGKVAAFRVSPNGAKVVFIADKETAGRPELYSVPADGSALPTKISTGLVFAAGKVGVSSFQISPDSGRVVFLADPDTTAGVNELFSAPIDGSSAPVKLNVAGAAPVTGIGVSADSAWAVFFGVDTASASGAVEVYRAAIATAGSAVQLSDVGTGNVAGDVVAAALSPDSGRIVYTADGLTDNVFQIYSVPIAAAGPGSDVLLSAALGSVGLVRINLDSSRVVYTSDAVVPARMEVFSVPIGGGVSLKLNPSMAGDGATAVEISPDGTRVVYLADQTTAGVNEVYAAQMLTASSGTRLNTPMVSPQYADTVKIGPDGITVLYEADQTTPGTYQLLRVPITGGAAPSALYTPTSPDDVGAFQGLGLPIIGKRAVYPVFGAAVNLFSVPFDGSAPWAQINPALAAGDRLFNAFLPAHASRLLAYGAGPSSATVTRKIVSAAIRADLPTEQVNVTAAGTSGVGGYEISADEKYAIYLQDQDTSGKPELYSRQLDSDGDTVVNAVDNCPFVANADQASVIFPATVTPVNQTAFTWGTALDVRFVRGPLKTSPPYQTNLSGMLAEASGFVDAGIPAVGTGWYYLFATDCPGRSYQTAAGAEPGRDTAAFP